MNITAPRLVPIAHPTSLHMDFSSAKSLSVAELANLTRVAQRISRKGGEVFLSGVNAVVQLQLEAVRLHKLVRLIWNKDASTAVAPALSLAA